VTRNVRLRDSCGEEDPMGLSYEQARRHAEAAIDAFNRRDADAMAEMLHEKATHRGPLAERHTGRERGHAAGKEAQRAFLQWLWEQGPALRHVLEEVFVGTEGYAFLTHGDDGTRYVFVNQVDDDGLVIDTQVYHGPPPAP